MALLKTEPSQPVRTLEELLAIAHAMEREAATRYAELAQRMLAEGDRALAEVFERLAAEERGHLDSVVRWSEAEKGRAPDPALLPRQLPETFDDEGVSATDPRLLTSYRALSMAVRNEERAFAFWTYVAAHAERPEIRTAAEAMAHEELDHVATLRRERRRAFHAERSSAATVRGAPASPDLAALEQRLAELLEDRAEAVEAAQAESLQEFAREARRNALDLRRVPALSAALSGPPGRIPGDAAALSELLVDRYLEAAERLRDEDDLVRAQALARSAIVRLAWLREDLSGIGRPGR